ncbi:MAG: T9SS type A sorting domain-containing protein [Flavobacteriales bacterium]|nr:MAG: T9SS type A sorting domain-containing protein [Flavobacteriales bacterium]
MRHTWGHRPTTDGHSAQPSVSRVRSAGAAHYASRCGVGGNPVYQARSLYTLVDETLDFDDALLCVAAGYAVKNDDQEKLRVMVFPNPNRDGSLNFRVLGLVDNNLTATVKLFDELGREVGSTRMNGDRTTMDVSQLAQGA